ncbi:acetoacetate decarboxylase family protein [Dyadobacter sandarakinus]|uniref:Acetoacetate decarboxylase family protein n=1 Tax=Dyadobacter sandarakinus TaxID=2747268 RepID=A0ABX7I7M4_9BACT|nr:acetoacetate decarboxylase family protein [Dyadobacter sandarakinus]QRR01482.1 acetoacetate decarboxylase family protein [Dyadobacter sandarakinus]
MKIPKRIRDYTGKKSLVDGIPFTLPVEATKSPAIMAGFFCDYEKATELMPGNELHPFKYINGKALFIVTVIDYRVTTIGKYIEYSLAIACTKGARPGPKLLPAVFMKSYGTGQYVLDLPVSSEISVKGGKGIWGMPKHQASLDFKIEANQISSQYEKDGEFAFRIEIEKPQKIWLPVSLASVNYSHFRNMLVASYIYFKSKAGLQIGKSAVGSIYVGDHPRTRYLRDLKIESSPFFTMYLPEIHGVLDDHFDCWFVTYDSMPATMKSDGLDSIVNLKLNEEWLAPPKFTDYQKFKI